MKFIVSSDLLYRNLSAINGVMGTNSTMPILENFLVTIEGNQLKLTASDLESTMTSVIELDNVDLHLDQLSLEGTSSLTPFIILWMLAFLYSMLATHSQGALRVLWLRF